MRKTNLWVKGDRHLVHDHEGTLAEIGDLLLGKVEHSTRGSDEDVHHAMEPHDVLLETGSASGDHYLYAHMLAELLAHLRRL